VRIGDPLKKRGQFTATRDPGIFIAADVFSGFREDDAGGGIRDFDRKRFRGVNSVYSTLSHALEGKTPKLT